MHPAYFETRFRTQNPVSEWPFEFVILSACATTGETWKPEENAAADRALEGDLVRRAGWLVRIVGYSPVSGHAEPSWATEMPLAEARETGRRFRQDAIFLVRGDALCVTRCDESAELASIGSFRGRLDR